VTQPLVIVPYAAGALRAETVHAVQMQWPAAHFVSLPDDPYAYADLLRLCWHLVGEVVICEHDVLPPHRSIARLIACPEPWCTHLHWIEDRYQSDTLGLCHFSAALRLRYPELADDALAPPDPQTYVRRGWTALDPAANEATMARHGRRATLRPDAPTPGPDDDRSAWPSAIHWRTCDSRLARVLRGLGVEPHVHEPPTVHLHPY
jgi:hypothetical protein